jgi:acylphosphatase
MALARHAIVHGRVQGVAFRHHTKVLARELGLAGWVRNLPGGEVEVWIEGDEDAQQRLVTWLGHGPPLAQVAGLELSERPPQGLAGFVVRFDSGAS